MSEERVALFCVKFLKGKIGGGLAFFWPISYNDTIKERSMERKSFERGTVVGGVVRIVISVVAVVVAVIVILNAIRTLDPEEMAGKIFMCVIGGIMVIFAVTFSVYGVQMILNGKKSLEVSRKGHEERGRILDLTITEVTEHNNGAVSRYNVYTLKFEYTDDSGNLCESSEQVSPKIYKKLEELQLVPILVLGERAIFDRKKFEQENFME